MTRRIAPLLALALAALPGSAAAAPDCPERFEARTLLEGQGKLESAVVDPRGPLWFTSDKGLMRLDRPGEEARVVAAIPEPGGIAFDLAGNLIVGSGNTFAKGSMGDATGPAQMFRVDPATGATEVFATGLSMANGIVRAPDGAFLASNAAGFNIDRVADGRTQRGWARVQSGNGMAIDAAGRWLYVAQTFKTAAIQQVDLADPSRVTPFVEAGPDDAQAGLDGMDRDAAGSLFVAANAKGEVWRVAGAPPEICVVVRGLPTFPDGPSAIAVGRAGTPFPPENVYVVAFDGSLVEIAGAAAPAEPGSGTGGPPPDGGPPGGGPSGRPAPAQAVRLRVTPRVARIRRRTRFAIVVERFAAHGWQPAPRARVRFAGRTYRVGARGTARVTRRFRRPVRLRLRARYGGLRSPAVIVRVTRS